MYNNNENRNHKMTLVIFPNAKGVAYVLCEGQHKIHDYGIKKINIFSIDKYLSVIQNLINVTKAEIVLLRECDQKKHKLSKRNVYLINKIKDMAILNNLKLYNYSREQIKQVFLSFGATSKHEIAKLMTEWYPKLKNIMPKYRKLYMPEPYHMGVFDAFSLVATHYYLTD